jgi:hypothetical protein
MENFCKKILFGRDIELQLKIEINSERKNRVFLTKKLLAQGRRGKNRIKNYKSDHHEFKIFGKNF